MNNLLEFGVFVLSCSSIGLSWHLITRQGEIADGFVRLLDQLTQSDKVHKVLHDCAKCVAGQVATWTFFFVCHPYDPILHLITVTSTIVTTAVVSKYLES